MPDDSQYFEEIEAEKSDLLREASDPSTPGFRLRKIMEESSNSAVLRAIAGNPNCGTDMLWTLANFFPRNVLANPVIPLLHLENPDLVVTIPPTSFPPILCIDSLPQWFVQSVNQAGIAGHYQVKEFIQEYNVSANKDASNWQADLDAGVDKAFFGTFSFSGNQFHFVGRHFEELLRKDLVPQWILRPLQRQAESILKSKKLGSPERPTAHLLPGPRLLTEIHLIKSSTLPAVPERRTVNGLESLSIFVNSPDDICSRMEQTIPLWRHDEKADPDLLKVATSSHSRLLLIAVARHVSTPHDAMVELAQHEDSWVRGALARNSSLPNHLIERLAEDEHCVVRANIARHPDTTIEVLERLADDADGEVLEAVRRRLGAPVEIVERATRNLESARKWGGSRPTELLAKFPQTPPEVLHQLAISEDHTTRMGVARNLRTWPKTLDLLVSDEEDTVRAAVASHPALPVDSLMQLSTDVDRVKRSVVRNRNLPVDFRIDWVFNSANLDTSLCPELAQNPSITTQEIELLLDATDEILIENAIVERWGGSRSNKWWLMMRRVDRTLEALPQRQRLSEEIQTRFEITRSLKNVLKDLQSSLESDRILALSSPDLPLEVMEFYLYKPEWVARAAIALNPVAPARFLSELSGDRNPVVRHLALTRLKEIDGEVDHA